MTTQQPTPTPPGSPQGSGERKHYSLTGADAGDGLLRVFVDHGCRHPSPPIVVIPMPEPSKDLERAARRHLAPRQPSNAERQAWEEERRRLRSDWEEYRDALQRTNEQVASLREENARLAGEKALAEEAYHVAVRDLQDVGSPLVRPNLREQNERLRARVTELEAVIEADRPIANAEGRELRRLRARVEELEGLARDVVVRDVPTGGGDFESMLEPRKGVDIGAWSERRDEALSSLGEQGGEVAP